MGHDRRRFRLMLAAGAYCLAAAMFVAPAFAGLDSWTAIGPDGARVGALAVDSRNASIAYAGLRGGVILTTNDGGVNWSSANVGPSTANVNTIVVDPIRSMTAYAGTDAGVFRTTDGGRTWVGTKSSIGTQTTINTLVFDPHSPDTLYAGNSINYTGPVLFKSTDAAENWVVMPAASQLPISTIAFDPVSPSTLYGGVNGGIDGTTYGIFKSTDGGAHWAQLYRTTGGDWYPASVVALAVHPRSPSSLYALFDSLEFRTSADGGVTWSDLPDGIYAQSFAIDPVDPATFYVGNYDGAVYRTTDAGGHWTSANALVGRVYALAVSPSDPRIVYASGRTGISRSFDHGQTWSRQTLGIRSVGSRAMATDPGAPYTVYLAIEGGDIAKTTDGGARWTYSALGLYDQRLPFVTIDPSTPSTLYAGVQYWRPPFYKSTDGGAHWVAQSVGSAPNGILSFAIAPSRSSTLYVVTSEGEVAKSIDGGTTWASLSSNMPLHSALHVKVDPKSADTVYVAQDCGSPCFLKSTDGGDHWKNIPFRLPKSTTVSMLEYDPITPSTMYAAVNVSQDEPSVGGMLKSIDAGETWSALPAIVPLPGVTVSALAFDPAHPSRIFAATNAGVHRSSDGGATWAPVSSSGLPSYYVKDVSIDATGSLLRATLDEGLFEFQLANTLPSPSRVATITSGFTGSWYNPAQNGHGFMLEVLPGIPMQLLASWFTFAPQGGQSWITALGPIYGGQAALQANQSVGSGGRFPPNFDAANVHQEGWGTLTFTFSDCNHGRVDWSSTASGYGSGGMDLERLTLPAGLSCSDTGSR